MMTTSPQRIETERRGKREAPFPQLQWICRSWPRVGQQAFGMTIRLVSHLIVKYLLLVLGINTAPATIDEESPEL
jgi:hypothetical protein